MCVCMCGCALVTWMCGCAVRVYGCMIAKGECVDLGVQACVSVKLDCNNPSFMPPLAFGI